MQSVNLCIVCRIPSLPKVCKINNMSKPLGIGAHPNAIHVHPNNIHGFPVSGDDIRNSSISFAFTVAIFSSEVGKLKWFSLDLALKLALYT